MKERMYNSLVQDAPVTFNVAWHEEIEENHAYPGSGMRMDEALDMVRNDTRLSREIHQSVQDRLIEN